MMKSGSLKLYRWLLAAAAVVLVSGPALAEKRVALVLGNSAYQNVAPLTNPVNDSAKMAATLKEAGFDIVDSRRLNGPHLLGDRPGASIGCAGVGSWRAGDAEGLLVVAHDESDSPRPHGRIHGRIQHAEAGDGEMAALA